MNDAFADGVAEGRAIAAGGLLVLYEVTYAFDGITIRIHEYDDLALALAEARAHLENGAGTAVEIVAITKDDVVAEEPATPQLEGVVEGEIVSD